VIQLECQGVLLPVAATIVYRGGIICEWTFSKALDSKIDDLVVVADSGVHFQEQATNLFR